MLFISQIQNQSPQSSFCKNLVNARIDSSIKMQAESILSQLGEIDGILSHRFRSAGQRASDKEFITILRTSYLPPL